MNRFTLSVLLALSINVSIYAQNTINIKISFNETNASLVKILNSIEEQTKIGYSITSSQINSSKPVTIIVKNINLDSALSLIFSTQPLYYIIESNTIRVTERKPPSPSLATKYTVAGKIINKKNEPVSNATVHVKGSDLSQASDEWGRFTFKNVDLMDTLIITCIGYKDKIKPLHNGDSFITIQLEQKAAALDEVFIKKAKKTKRTLKDSTQDATVGPGDIGSEYKMNSQTISWASSQNLSDRLKSITGEVLMTPQSAPDLNQSAINIRNRSTIIGNPNPLVVLNNHPYTGDLNNLNPNDIENITIIKDAAASPQWGVQSGNGVISITTKTGSYKQPLHVSAIANITAGVKPNLSYMPLISATDYISTTEILFRQGLYSSLLRSTNHSSVPIPVEIMDQRQTGRLSDAEADEELYELSKRDTRKQALKYLYRRSIHQQYHISMQGGSSYYRFYHSIGYDITKQNLVGNSDTRSTINMNNTFNFGKKGPEINLSIFLTQDVMNNNGIDIRSLSSPLVQLADEDGHALPVPKELRQAFIDSAGGGALLDWNYRPLDEIQLGNNKLIKSTQVVTATAKYKINNKIEANISYRDEHGQLENYDMHSEHSYFTRNLINEFTLIEPSSIYRPIPIGGILDRNVKGTISQNIQTEVKYNPINDEIHNFTVLIGTDVQHICSRNFKFRKYGLTEDNPAGTPIDYYSFHPVYSQPSTLQRITYVNGQTAAKEHYYSYYINALYTTFKKYSFFLGVRKTESNIFGAQTNKKGIPLWSVGFNWDINPEHLNLTLFTKLRLRFSEGYCGNASKNFSAFTTIQSGGTNVWGAPSNTIVNVANPALNWEKIAIMNCGLDFSLFKDKLWGSIEYYNKSGNGLLGYAPINPTLGVDVFSGNVAGMAGHGIETAFNTKTGNNTWQWQGTLLMSYVRDRVTIYSMYMGSIWYYCDPMYLNPLPGRPLYSIYSLKFHGLDPVTGDPIGMLNNQPTKDYNAILASPNFTDLVYHGPSTPVFYGSFRNTISWKQLELGCSFIWKTGYYFRRNSVNYDGLLYGTSVGDADITRRWKKSGDELYTNIPSLSPDYSRSRFFSYSSALVERGDHIRLQDIRLKYQLHKKESAKHDTPAIEVYAYANNIGIIWTANNKGIDPDYISNPPEPFSITLGLRANF